MATPIVRDDIVLDEYEQSIEDASQNASKLVRNQNLHKQIEKRIEEQKLKSVTFKVPAKSFNIFKQISKKKKIPYSKVLSALIDLYNRGKISI